MLINRTKHNARMIEARLGYINWRDIPPAHAFELDKCTRNGLASAGFATMGRLHRAIQEDGLNVWHLRAYNIGAKRWAAIEGWLADRSKLDG